MHLHELTIKQARGLLQKGDTSPRELLEALLTRIEAVDEKVKAYVTVTADEAREMADKANKTVTQGEKGVMDPLEGVPLGIKDNMCTKGVRTTCSSKMLENFVPPYESTATQKLWDSGAVLLGKLNMDEFAMGSSTEHSAFFRTCNPWHLERVTGGSSGGSAAAVASDMCLGALGSDTGGSIRQPAAFCSVVGLKPTYGRVSRYGLVAFASSLDQIGPITKTVEDSAILLNAISGHDPRDSTSSPEETPDFTRSIGKDIKGLKIGVPSEYFIDGMLPEVEKITRNAIKQLESLGAEIIEVTLPHTDYAVPAYYIIAPSEASSNLARYDGVKYGFRAEGAADLMDMYMKSRSQGFGAEVKRRIMLGTYALSSGYYDAYYLKAQQARTLIKKDFDDAFKTVDVIASPTCPETAFLAGEKTSDPMKMYLSDIFTISANLAGNPGISVPCGFTGEGLPVGLQLIGKNFDEATVLRAAHAYEQSTDWHKKRPSL